MQIEWGLMEKRKSILVDLHKASHQVARLGSAVWQYRGTMSALRNHYEEINSGAVRRVAVFPNLGLAYNRIKKNANTSTVILLRQIETGMIEERNAAKWNARTFFDLSTSELKSLDHLHSFVIIRNPYSRTLSAFLEKFRSSHYQRRYGMFSLTPEGFGEFLVWLGKGGLTKDRHWDLQTKLMMLPLKGYDTVLHFENYQSELVALLETRGIKLPDNALHQLYPSDTTKNTGADAKLQQFYTPWRANLVREFFAADFAALGYKTTLSNASTHHTN